ncbi:unnamed protein product [Linum trigynum]|uniref:Uncharacterized protein n=1 Tax=Linum trigynum TaxID=586398 RepID=A0AAV2E4S8_9ROSI
MDGLDDAVDGVAGLTELSKESEGVLVFIGEAGEAGCVVRGESLVSAAECTNSSGLGRAGSIEGGLG